MGSFIARQPNGKLCRFSSIVDTITHYNMSDEDYIELCAEMAREEAKEALKTKVRPFKDVLEQFTPNNETVFQFIEKIREMGDFETLYGDLASEED